MWNSIQTIHRPNNLQDAFRLHCPPDQIFLAGGSHLVSQRSGQVSKLILIQHLLGKKIEVQPDEIRIDAGVTLQEVADQLGCRKDVFAPLGQTAHDSCFSKNIRNQRTVGGEVAEKKLQSDFYSAIYALSAKLQITTDTQEYSNIQDWNGRGIITKIIVSSKSLENFRFFRYTILPSAGPFLIVSLLHVAEGWKCVVTGKVPSLQEIILPKEKCTPEGIREISQQLTQNFSEDQYGSPAYKSHLIALSLSKIL